MGREEFYSSGDTSFGRLGGRQIPVSNDTAAVKVQQIEMSLDSRKFYECFEADDRFGIDEPERASLFAEAKLRVLTYAIRR
jgi:hypothetical protein